MRLTDFEGTKGMSNTLKLPRSSTSLSQSGFAITPIANSDCNGVGTVMNKTIPKIPTKH